MKGKSRIIAAAILLCMVFAPFRAFAENRDKKYTGIDVVLRDIPAADSAPVELRVSDGYVQWKYAGEDDGSWRILAAVSAISGAVDGQVNLRVYGGYIQYQCRADGLWQNLAPVAQLKGSADRKVEIRTNSTHIQWRYCGDSDTKWQNVVRLSDLMSNDIKKISVQTDSGYVQYRYDGEEEWRNLVSVTQLTAPVSGNDIINLGGELTPAIGENGNWWVGERDTGIKVFGSIKSKIDKEGVGIEDVTVDRSGQLIVTLSDGSSVNAGMVGISTHSEKGSESLWKTVSLLAVLVAAVSLAVTGAMTLYMYKESKGIFR